jgi:hypothetical protein
LSERTFPKIRAIPSLGCTERQAPPFPGSRGKIVCPFPFGIVFIYTKNVTIL